MIVGMAAVGVWAAVKFVGNNLPARARIADTQRPGESLVGRASVIDGDTFEIGGERVRLNGVDAPEHAQLCNDLDSKPYRCGAEAARFLDEFLAASRPVHCEFVSRDRYGRFVGRCRRQDGVDVAQALVGSGYAFDWPQYSHGFYAPAEAAARSGRKGLWRGTFVKPWDYRHSR